MSSGLALVANALKNRNAIEKCNEIYQNHLIIIAQSRPCMYIERDVWDTLTRLHCYEFLCNNEQKKCDQKKCQFFGVTSKTCLQWVFRLMNAL
ncbi:hypothetical protein CR513_48309, partial [Mucuna pruriens]